MADAVSFSLSKFTGAVQAAVKAAVAKHPKFKLEVPNAVTVSYLIRGIPIPDAIAAAATLAETQAFAAEVAGHIAQAQPEALGAATRTTPEPAVISIGRHVIVGIPPVSLLVQLQK
jgi:hypothetical protein